MTDVQYIGELTTEVQLTTRFDQKSFLVLDFQEKENFVSIGKRYVLAIACKLVLSMQMLFLLFEVNDCII